MNDKIKSIAKPIIIFLLGAGLAVASKPLGFDIKGALCESSQVSK